MTWLDIDHNGVVDCRDFFILDEILRFEDEEMSVEDTTSDGVDEVSDDDYVW